MALLAKESAICLPFLILVISALRRIGWARRIRQILKTFALFLSILVGFIIIRALVVGSVMAGTEPRNT